jgi:hypothetical protein
LLHLYIKLIQTINFKMSSILDKNDNDKSCDVRIHLKCSTDKKVHSEVLLKASKVFEKELKDADNVLWWNKYNDLAVYRFVHFLYQKEMFFDSRDDIHICFQLIELTQHYRFEQYNKFLVNQIIGMINDTTDVNILYLCDTEEKIDEHTRKLIRTSVESHIYGLEGTCSFNMDKLVMKMKELKEMGKNIPSYNLQREEFDKFCKKINIINNIIERLCNYDCYRINFKTIGNDSGITFYSNDDREMFMKLLEYHPELKEVMSLEDFGTIYDFNLMWHTSDKFHVVITSLNSSLIRTIIFVNRYEKKD